MKKVQDKLELYCKKQYYITYKWDKENYFQLITDKLCDRFGDIHAQEKTHVIIKKVNFVGYAICVLIDDLIFL